MRRSGVATWLPCNNYWPGGNTKKFILIHGTASGAPQTAYQLATGSEFNDGQTASVHYIVDKEVERGESSMCYQVVDEDDMAWGNCCVSGGACPRYLLPLPGVGACHDPWINASLGTRHNYNGDTISIENMKYASDNSDTLTADQWAKLKELVIDISDRNGIPLIKATRYDIGGIIGHFDLDPVNRARCPGTFDWNKFLAEINADKTITVAQAQGYAQAAGFTGWQADVIVAIAQAESGLKYWHNYIHSDGSLDMGVLGYTLGASMIDEATAYDPAKAFQWAYTSATNQGTDFTFWTTYTDGSYLAYMPVPLYCDVSQYQGKIAWGDYAKWAAQWDGTPRVTIRATKGMMDASGLVVDTLWAANISAARQAGCDVRAYHNASPNLNTPQLEWCFFQNTIGKSVTKVMLSYEQGDPTSTVQGAAGLADWAFQWLTLAKQAGYDAALYASLDYIQNNLQDSRLSAFPLILADWTHDQNARPPAPAPWSSYQAIQYTDQGINIPGIGVAVDVNVLIIK